MEKREREKLRDYVLQSSRDQVFVRRQAILDLLDQVDRLEGEK